MRRALSTKKKFRDQNHPIYLSQGKQVNVLYRRTKRGQLCFDRLMYVFDELLLCMSKKEVLNGGI